MVGRSLRGIGSGGNGFRVCRNRGRGVRRVSCQGNPVHCHGGCWGRYGRNGKSGLYAS